MPLSSFPLVVCCRCWPWYDCWLCLVGVLWRDWSRDAAASDHLCRGSSTTSPALSRHPRHRPTLHQDLSPLWGGARQPWSHSSRVPCRTVGHRVQSVYQHPAVYWTHWRWWISGSTDHSQCRPPRQLWGTNHNTCWICSGWPRHQVQVSLHSCSWLSVDPSPPPGFEPRPAKALSPLAQQALWLINSGLAHWATGTSLQSAVAYISFSLSFSSHPLVTPSPPIDSIWAMMLVCR